LKNYRAMTKAELIQQIESMEQARDTLHSDFAVERERLLHELEMQTQEAHQAEESLRESNTLSESLLQTIPFGIDIVDQQGVVLYLNPAMEKVVGKQALGKVCWLSYRDDQTQCADCPLKQPIHLGETKSLESAGVLGNRVFEIAHTGMIYRGTTAILEVFYDITERKHAEKALRDSEEGYRLMFLNNPHPMWAFDADTLAFLAVNDAAVRHYGYSRDEFLAMTIKDICPPEDLPALLQQTSNLPAGLNEPKVWRHLKKDGTCINVEISSHGSSFAGKPARIVLAHDITARLLAEQSLNDKIAALEALAEIDREVIAKTEIEPVLELVCRRAAELLHAPKTALGVRLASGQMQMIASYGLADPARVNEELERLDHTSKMGYRTPRGAIVQNEIPADDPSMLATRARENIRSYILAPLFAEGKYIGSMFVFDSTPHEWKPDDVELVELLAGQTALALEKMRLFEETVQRLAEMEAVDRVSTALRVAHSLDEMLPMLLDETLAVLGTSAGDIRLYDPQNQVLQQVVARGWLANIASRVPLDQSVAGHVFANNEPYVTRELATDPRTAESTRSQIPPHWGGVSMPIRSIHQVVGVMFIAIQSPRELTSGELHLLSTLSEIAGNAIHRTRLSEETERNLERLASLRTIDMAISSSFDLGTTLNVLLGQTTKQLGVDAAGVWALSPHTDTLRFAAGRGFRTRLIEQSQIRLGDEFTGQVALQRQILSVPDLKKSESFPIHAKRIAGEGFVSYFGAPLIAKGQLKGVLEIYHRAPLEPDQDWLNFLDTLAGQAAIAIDNAELFDGLERSNFELTFAYDRTIEGWSRALDLRDKVTEGHTQRVTAMTEQLARAMGMSDAELVHVRRGALLHDIGKMGIPDNILLKQGPLTDEEQKIMHKHPVYAYDLLSPIEYLRSAMDIPYYHHEKLDGTGYPLGLKGEQIPLSARIFAVVDVWDALTSDRPYRPAWTQAQAREYIINESGKHFDPKVVQIFLSQFAQDNDV